MNILSDDIIDFIISKLNYKDPRKIFKLRIINSTFKRVINNYRIHTKNITNKCYSKNNSFYNQYNTYSKYSFYGLLWSTQNGYIPNYIIINHSSLNDKDKINILLNNVPKNNLTDLTINITKSNNNHAFSWLIDNNIPINSNLLFNINSPEYILLIVKKYNNILNNINHNNFIRYLCKSTKFNIELQFINSILKIMYPIIEHKHLSIESYTDIISHTLSSIQKKYIFCNLNKILNTNYIISDLALFLVSIIFYTDDWDIIKKCLIIVDNIESNRWVYETILHIIQRTFFRSTCNNKRQHWKYIHPIMTTFNYPKETLLLNAIYTSIILNVDNYIIKQLINLGFKCNLNDIKAACKFKNIEIIKILANNLT